MTPRKIAQLAMLPTLVGCGFDVGGSQVDATPPPDMDAPQDVVRWAVVSLAGASSSIFVQPIVNDTFEAACPSQAAPDAYRALLPHPAKPYVYGVESRFEGMTIACNSVTATNLGDVGVQREVQRIVFDPLAGTGFFTVDGPGALNVYRFTTTADGAPTVTGNANGPVLGGALVLEGSELFLAGESVVDNYHLIGATLDLPATYEPVSGCSRPVDLLTSGSTLLEFCSDTAVIQRFTTSPFATMAPGGSLGTVDRVVALPGDRAIAARNAPAALALVSLANGTPTWVDGPSLVERVTAMAVSPDGAMLLTANRGSSTTTSELRLWKVDSQTITPAGVSAVEGTITALAFATPGT